MAPWEGLFWPRPPPPATTARSPFCPANSHIHVGVSADGCRQWEFNQQYCFRSAGNGFLEMQCLVLLSFAAMEASAAAISKRGTSLIIARLLLSTSVAPLHTIAHLRPASLADRPISQRTLSRTGVGPQFRCMSAGFVSNLPPVKDAKIAKALSGLLGHGWLKLEPQVKSAVESAISSGTDDTAGKETLIDAWRSAQAVESFGGLLIDMLLEISDLCGDSGENVGKMPDSTYQAVEAARKKYLTYLNAFAKDEIYLKKKVETELGGVLLQIKQRLTGMHPKLSEITVLGTSGLAGSYIEKRRLPG